MEGSVQECGNGRNETSEGKPGTKVSLARFQVTRPQQRNPSQIAQRVAWKGRLRRRWELVVVVRRPLVSRQQFGTNTIGRRDATAEPHPDTCHGKWRSSQASTLWAYAPPRLSSLSAMKCIR